MPSPSPHARRRRALTAVLLLAAALAGGPARAQRPLVAAREWTDATGMFKVTASLVALDGDTLTLRQEDGSDLEIGYGDLSALDRIVVQRTRRRVAPRKGDEAREPLPFDPAAVATNHTDFPPAEPVAVPADPALADPVPAAGRVAIPRVDPFDRVARLLPAGEGLVLVAVENSTPGKPLPTRVVWVDPRKQAVVAKQSLPGPDIVLDYHPLLERLLTVSREKSTAEGAARQVLTLWDATPGRKGMTRIVAWRAPCADKQPPARHPWGRIVDDAAVLHQSSREEFTCWDIDERKARYRLAQYPGHSPTPALSPGRRHVALPDTRRVQVCDAATGAVVVSLPVGTVSGVAFDAAGRRLALVVGGTVQVHDLSDPASPIPVFRAQGCSVHTTALEWLGDDTLLVQSAEGLGAVAWSVTKGLPAWRYQWRPTQSGDSIAGLAERVVGGTLLYAAPGADPDDAASDADGELATVVAAAVPEAAVSKALDDLPTGLTALVEAGTVVATKVPASPEHDRIIGAVARTFERTKWLYDAASPAVIEAGKTSDGTVSYTDAEGHKRPLKQVTPTTLRMAVVVHGVTVVEARLSSDIPDALVLGAGATDADLAAKLPPPPVGWFDRVRLPAVLVDVTEADGLGTTECTARGLVTKAKGSGKPPKGAAKSGE